jgi:transcriptional regulator with GAF, ATPase, and Fis domain
MKVVKPKIGFQTLVDSHELPFIVIDKNFRIVALNQAYKKTYARGARRAIGEYCYKASHSHPRPCFEVGEDCPYQQVYEKNIPHSCLHTHRDVDGHSYWVRVSAFPIAADDGETYIGETIQELTRQDSSESEETVHMVGESPAFLAMIEQLQLVANSKVPVLLMGETGTGKELAAKFLHQHSERRDRPYITVDCTILNESLIESELFGHERGSFTGNVGKKEGLIELANGGTLFLDEIGELPAAMQSKLLRVLDSGEFRRVGGQRTLNVDVRVVCATNRHLWEAVKEQQFREDLYYRIAGMTVRLPSLRERQTDIPLLANALLGRLSRSARRRYRLSDDAMDMLKARNYPGNIRELRNYLFAVSACSANGLIDKPQLIKAFDNASRLIPKTNADETLTRRDLVNNDLEEVVGFDDIESRCIAKVLKEQHGSRKKTAEILGISTRTLYRKMKRYGLR